MYIFFHFKRQLNLLSTATPAVGAWLVPIDQLKSSLNKLETEGTLRICAVMGCIMTEALEVCLSTMQSVIQSLLLKYSLIIYCCWKISDLHVLNF